MTNGVFELPAISFGTDMFSTLVNHPVHHVIVLPKSSQPQIVVLAGWEQQLAREVMEFAFAIYQKTNLWESG
jgi:hypothetical protein